MAVAIAAMIALGLVLDLVVGLPRYVSLLSSSLGVVLIAGALYLEGRATYVLWTLGGGTPNPVEPPKHLVTEGPYRFSRNPLYVARLLFLWGASLYLGSVGVLSVSILLLSALHFVLLPREEGRLEKRFGDSYNDYRRDVPRWIAVTGTNRRRVDRE